MESAGRPASGEEKLPLAAKPAVERSLRRRRKRPAASNDAGPDAGSRHDASARRACYADHAAVEQVTLVENVRLARDTYRLRFHAPEIARRILPGQFLMVRLAAGNDPLLARPLALYDTVLDAQGEPVGIDVVYLVVGKLTGALARLSPGDKLTVWGPLGNGFSPRPTRTSADGRRRHRADAVFGTGPRYLQRRRYGDPALAPPRARRVTLCYGARTADYLAGVDDFSDWGSTCA